MFIQKILPIQNNKVQKNINFEAMNLAESKRLTEEISKRLYGKQGSMDVYKRFPAAEGITISANGLPQAWLKRIKNIEEFDLPSFLENLGQIFTRDRHFSNIDSMKNSLKLLFSQYKIIDKEDKLNVSYLEKGFFGRAYKLDINGEDPKVIKEYKRTYRYHNNHGNYSEQNVAEYISRYSGSNTNVAKYYYGDTKNGVMLLDFISKETPLAENIIELDEIGLAYNDAKPRNLVNNYIIDFGGMITISNLVGNEEAQNVYRIFKYLEDDSEKMELFNKILDNNNNEKYNDKLIGLTHSIKFLPKDQQFDAYKKMYEFNNTDINIAIVENFKNFGIFWSDNEIVRSLAETKDIRVKETIAREIKHLPSDLTHSLMEKYALEEKDNNTIKKYLARNLNYFYKNIEQRSEIFDNLMRNANTYANIALANSLKNLPLVERNMRFGKLLEINDPIVTSALARNIEIFNNDEKISKKWIDRLMEKNDIRVKRALCESVNFIPEVFKKETFEKLLDVQDMNAKEFLAETLTSVPDYYMHTEWFDRIIEASGNSVKRELAKTLQTVKKTWLKEKWAKELNEKGDSSVKEILKKQGLA